MSNRLASHLNSAVVNRSHVQNKSSVVDEALREQVVDGQRVRDLPAVQTRAGTHDSNSRNHAGRSNPKTQLADPCTFQRDWQ